MQRSFYLRHDSLLWRSNLRRFFVCARGIGLNEGEADVQVPAKWRGTNVLGWALMQARDRLRAESSTR